MALATLLPRARLALAAPSTWKFLPGINSGAPWNVQGTSYLTGWPLPAITEAKARFIRVELRQLGGESIETTAARFRSQVLDEAWKHQLQVIALISNNSVPDWDPVVWRDNQARLESFAGEAATAVKVLSGHPALMGTQLWNEPNDPKTELSEKNYAFLLGQTYPLISSMTKVITAGLVDHKAYNGYNYVSRVLSHGKYTLRWPKPMLDAVAVHPYGRSAPNGILSSLQEMRAATDRYYREYSVPLAVTEFGIESGMTDEGRETQSGYLTEAYLMMRREASALKLWLASWWNLNDYANEKSSSTYGLFAGDQTVAKPAFYAYQALG